MIPKLVKRYTVFNFQYRNKDKKMYSRLLKKEVLGNSLNKNFFKEFWERTVITTNWWDIQLEIQGYYPNPLSNQIILDLISQMRDTVKLLDNEQDTNAEYIRDMTQQFLDWFDKEYPKKNISKKQPKQITFKDLFINPDNAQKVKEILEQHHYTKNGDWIASPEINHLHKGTNREFISVYLALLEKEGLLKETDKTKLGKSFSQEFNKNIPNRTSRDQPNRDDIDKFIRLFRELN